MKNYPFNSSYNPEARSVQFKNEMCGVGKAERAERSGMPRFFFGYFLCSNDKESNNNALRISNS